VASKNSFEVLAEEKPKNDLPVQSLNGVLNGITMHNAVVKKLCAEGKVLADHSDWGRLQEISNLSERIANILFVIRSNRPSGVGVSNGS